MHRLNEGKWLAETIYFETMIKMMEKHLSLESILSLLKEKIMGIKDYFVPSTQAIIQSKSPQRMHFE